MPAVFQRTNQLVEKTLGICVKKDVAWVMPVPLSCDIISKLYRQSHFKTEWYNFIFLGKWMTILKYFSYFCQQHIMSKSL